MCFRTAPGMGSGGGGKAALAPGIKATSTGRLCPLIGRCPPRGNDYHEVVVESCPRGA
ncbi:hypothetical protein dqs_2402 [Azoarcus olearius]|nr:hypothetical protein dqs_2402 [Azoarcus olearius]